MSDPRRDRSGPLAIVLIIVAGLLLIAGFNFLVMLVQSWFAM